MMSFEIYFSKPSGDNAICFVTFSIGNLKIASAPQEISDHYRDFYAMLSSLKRRSLSKIFICNEPLINLTFQDLEDIEFFVFEFDEGNNIKIINVEKYDNVTSYLEGMLTSLEAMGSYMGHNVEKIREEVEKEIRSGIYHPFIKLNNDLGQSDSDFDLER